MATSNDVPVRSLTIREWIQEFYPECPEWDNGQNENLYRRIWNHWSTKSIEWNEDRRLDAGQVIYTEKGKRYHFNMVNVYSYERDWELMNMFLQLNQEYFDSLLPLPGCLQYAEDLHEYSGGRVVCGLFQRAESGNRDPKKMRIYILGRLKIMDPDEIRKTLVHEMLHMWEMLEMGDTDDESSLFIYMCRHKGINRFVMSTKIVNKKTFEKEHKFDNCWE